MSGALRRPYVRQGLREASCLGHIISIISGSCVATLSIVRNNTTINTCNIITAISIDNDERSIQVTTSSVRPQARQAIVSGPAARASFVAWYLCVLLCLLCVLFNLPVTNCGLLWGGGIKQPRNPKHPRPPSHKDSFQRQHNTQQQQHITHSSKTHCRGSHCHRCHCFHCQVL